MTHEDYDQVPGWPAPDAGVVHSTANTSRSMAHRSPKWRETVNAKRRLRYRLARKAGHTPQEAMAMSQGKDWW